MNKEKEFLLRVAKSATLFLLFGTIYFLIECVFKGKISDYRMAIMGGCLGIAIGLINNLFTFETDFILQCLVGSMIVTLCEAIFGTYWCNNGIYIWDYSQLPLSAVNGQINLLFSIAWVFLSAVAIITDDIFRYYVFHETEKPYYIIHGKKIFAFGGNK